ncbi:MAG: hypothetical protein LUD69_07910 [Oscillospiraceae bacterium]|nr:hypothetical protein [Oscillospiraceae bacterium]
MSKNVWTQMPVPDAVFQNYMNTLVNAFFKIIPIREELDQQGRTTDGGAEREEDSSLGVYMRSLQAELLGCRGLVAVLKNDSRLMSLVSILQYLIDNQDCSFRTLRREVFKAIRICNALQAQYGEVTQ